MSKPRKFSGGLGAIVSAEPGKRLQLDDPEPAPVVAAPVIAAPAIAATLPAAEPEVLAQASNDAEPASEPANLVVVTAPGQLTARQRRKKSAAQSQQLVNAKHMGTLETPYVRQRDGMPTRKVSVVLTVELARQIQIHCAHTGQRSNDFIEESMRAALARVARPHEKAKQA